MKTAIAWIAIVGGIAATYGAGFSVHKNLKLGEASTYRVRVISKMGKPLHLRRTDTVPSQTLDAGDSVVIVGVIKPGDCVDCYGFVQETNLIRRNNPAITVRWVGLSANTSDSTELTEYFRARGELPHLRIMNADSFATRTNIEITPVVLIVRRDTLLFADVRSKNAHPLSDILQRLTSATTVASQ